MGLIVSVFGCVILLLALLLIAQKIERMLADIRASRDFITSTVPGERGSAGARKLRPPFAGR